MQTHSEQHNNLPGLPVFPYHYSWGHYRVNGLGKFVSTFINLAVFVFQVGKMILTSRLKVLGSYKPIYT